MVDEVILKAKTDATGIPGTDSGGAPIQLAEAAPALRAAGIMHIVDGKILLVQRSPEGDHSGEWAFPGGKIEDGETAEAAARREWGEELGRPSTAEPLVEHLRTVREGVDFTTFIQRGTETFAPLLNNEHVGFMWAAPSEVPSHLHPGCRIALDKLAWNELDVARNIAAGVIMSPQRYMNVWLFDLRITGTGAAFRSKTKEFTWRRPALYLNDEFLARCNGLSVIHKHPVKTDRLNSEEFSDRVVGSILLPYIRDDEVWGIAKVYDDETIKMMRAGQMSTSPNVIVRVAADKTFSLDDGATLLIEGQPMLLDHLAICEQGVWDKGKAPSGVNIAGEMIMDEEEKKAAQAKADADEKEAADKAKADADAAEAKAKQDADADSMLDMVLSKLDSVCARMDAIEAKGDSKADAAEDEAAAKAKADADEEEAAAKAKADADDKAKEEESALADAAGAATAAELAAMKKQLADITAAMPKHLSDTDYADLANVQARADGVLMGFGDSASRPLQGETLIAYRKRLALGMQKHSAKWKDADLRAMDVPTFGIVEAEIYADSMEVARNPVDIEPGVLRQITRKDPETGVVQHTFAGRNTFVHAMKAPSKRAKFGERRTNH